MFKCWLARKWGPTAVHLRVYGSETNIYCRCQGFVTISDVTTWSSVLDPVKKFPQPNVFVPPGWILKWNMPRLWYDLRWSTPGLEFFLNFDGRWCLNAFNGFACLCIPSTSLPVSITACCPLSLSHWSKYIFPYGWLVRALFCWFFVYGLIGCLLFYLFGSLVSWSVGWFVTWSVREWFSCLFVAAPTFICPVSMILQINVSSWWSRRTTTNRNQSFKPHANDTCHQCCIILVLGAGKCRKVRLLCVSPRRQCQKKIPSLVVLATGKAGDIQYLLLCRRGETVFEVTAPQHIMGHCASIVTCMVRLFSRSFRGVALNITFFLNKMKLRLRFHSRCLTMASSC